MTILKDVSKFLINTLGVVVKPVSGAIAGMIYPAQTGGYPAKEIRADMTTNDKLDVIAETSADVMLSLITLEFFIIWFIARYAPTDFFMNVKLKQKLVEFKLNSKDIMAARK